MKPLIGLLFMLVTLNASAIDVNSSWSGSWYNPDQNGHGLSVEVNEKITIVYWYVYTPDGTPTFLITVGNNLGNVTSGTTFAQTGMKFGDFNPNDMVQTVWGTATVTFIDCNTASLEYASDDPAYGSGTIPMVRLFSVGGHRCTDSPLHGNYRTVLMQPGSNTRVGLATLFENGDMVYYAGNNGNAMVGMGTWSVVGNGLMAFDATTFPMMPGATESIAATGSFNEDGMKTNHGSNRQFMAVRVPSFQHVLKTNKMGGAYDIRDMSEAIVGAVTILADGTVSGSTLDGCTFNGALAVPNTNFNQATIDLQVANCDSTTNINGAAVYDFDKDEIMVFATDTMNGFIWTLTPQ